MVADTDGGRGMADLRKIAAQAAANGRLIKSYPDRQPSQYADKQFEYYADPTHLFKEKMLEYASDYIEALLQNWDNGGAWETVYIRMADVVRPSAAIQRHFDEYKMILPRDPSINYLQPGTKLQAMGSYWIVVNPVNISGGDGAGIVRRCNTVWNHLDWYGNVVSEPIVVENDRANASSPDAQTDQRIATGYYNVICQYNDFTRQINDNTRLILGSKAYQVTGYGDFDQEFTGDYDTRRLLYFSIRVLTQNDAADDMENHVAGGKAFSMTATATALQTIKVGDVKYVSVRTIRNGTELDPGDAEHPVSYTYSSNRPLVAMVARGTGAITGLRAGTATITATMVQNPSVTASVTVTVASWTGGLHFASPAPGSLDAYQSVSLETVYINSAGEESSPLIFDWTFAGADEGSYGVVVSGDRDNTATITCFGYSETPLTVTVSARNSGHSPISAEIKLNGF